MVETCVNLAGLALTYGLIRLLLVCIYSQHAPAQFLACLVAVAIMGLGARVTLTNFYVWIMVKFCGADEKKNRL